jgi:predicted lactoylglutathione lyase
MPTTITFGSLVNNSTTMLLTDSTTEAVTESGTSAATTASAALTSLNTQPAVRIVSTVAIRLAFGASPTATATSMLLPANAVEYFSLNTGDKIAIITA